MNCSYGNMKSVNGCFHWQRDFVEKCVRQVVDVRIN